VGGRAGASPDPWLYDFIYDHVIQFKWHVGVWVLKCGFKQFQWIAYVPAIWHFIIGSLNG
jgi:hypothetical protein